MTIVSCIGQNTGRMLLCGRFWQDIDSEKRRAGSIYIPAHEKEKSFITLYKK